MTQVYQESDLPQNPQKWDFCVRDNGGLDFFNGEEWEPFDPDKITGRVPINVAINPSENVAMDIYVDGEHKLRLYENRNVEFIGGLNG